MQQESVMQTGRRDRKGKQWKNFVLAPLWARSCERLGHCQTALGMLQHGLDLVVGDTGKTSQELVHHSAIHCSLALASPITLG